MFFGGTQCSKCEHCESTLLSVAAAAAACLPDCNAYCAVCRADRLHCVVHTDLIWTQLPTATCCYVSACPSVCLYVSVCRLFWLAVSPALLGRATCNWLTQLHCIAVQHTVLHYTSLLFQISLRVGSERCRISPPRFLMKCRKKRLSQASFLMCSVLFAFSGLSLVFAVSFLPARRYASAGNSDRNVSVCLSVTRRYCVKTKKVSGMISSPSGSPKTLVFWRQISPPNFKGFPRTGASKKGRLEKFSDILALSVNISKTVADTAKVTISD